MAALSGRILRNVERPPHDAAIERDAVLQRCDLAEAELWRCPPGELMDDDRSMTALDPDGPASSIVDRERDHDAPAALIRATRTSRRQRKRLTTKATARATAAMTNVAFGYPTPPRTDSPGSPRPAC